MDTPGEPVDHDDRVADALLDILDQVVTTIRLRKGPSESADEISDALLADLRRALGSFGLQLAPHDDGEREAARRLLARVHGKIPGADSGGAMEAAPARRPAGAEDVRPESQLGAAGGAKRGRRRPVLSPKLLRQALLGGVDQELGARLIRELRAFPTGDGNGLRVGQDGRDGPRSVNGPGDPPHRFLDPVLLRAARPTFRMIDQVLEKVSEEFRPLLEDLRLKFHESGYSVAELRQAPGANSWRMRQFNKEVGMEAKRLIPECRVLMASRLFRNTAKTVVEVASAVGFDSARGLNDLCRRWCGLPPSLLRSREKALQTALGELPDDVFFWFFLERCRRGEVAPAELGKVLAHLERLYGPVI